MLRGAVIANVRVRWAPNGNNTRSEIIDAVKYDYSFKGRDQASTSLALKRPFGSATMSCLE